MLKSARGAVPVFRPVGFPGAAYVLLLAGETAAVIGASHISDLHAFLAIIRQADTVPARASARALAVSGADLAEVEAALAEHAVDRPAPPDGAVILPADQDFDDEFRDALVTARGPKAGLAVGVTADDRVWVLPSAAFR